MPQFGTCSHHATGSPRNGATNGPEVRPIIEASASIIVLAPILVPVALHFGIDPVHFGLVIVVNLPPAMITPPFGGDLFAARTVARVSVDEIVLRLLPFVAVVFGCLAVVTYVAAVTTRLRDVVYR